MGIPAISLKKMEATPTDFRMPGWPAFVLSEIERAKSLKCGAVCIFNEAYSAISCRNAGLDADEYANKHHQILIDDVKKKCEEIYPGIKVSHTICETPAGSVYDIIGPILQWDEKLPVLIGNDRDMFRKLFLAQMKNYRY